MSTLSRKTLGYFDESPARGGTTRYLLEVLSGLDRDRYDVVFLAPRAYAWHEDLEALDIRVVTGEPGPAAPPAGAAPAPTPAAARQRKLPLPAEAALSLWLGKELRRFTRLFRKERVDLLHTNSTGAEPAPIAARLAGLPCVVGTWHVDSSYDLFRERESLWYRTLERASMRALHGAIAISQSTRNDWVRRCGLSEAYQRRIAVIPNGIASERLHRRRSREVAKAALGIAPGTPLVGSIGRLDHAKGYEYLIRALSLTVPGGGEAPILAIAGAGPLEPDLRALAEQLGVASRVRFVGFLREVRDLLEALDVYAQPSLCEAQGLALLEASGLEIPVVATAIGGMTETVLDGVTGLLVPARDPAALAGALSTLLHDPARRAEMGSAGRQRVLQEFGRERMVAQTVAFYEQMLTQRARVPTSTPAASGASGA